MSDRLSDSLPFKFWEAVAIAKTTGNRSQQNDDKDSDLARDRILQFYSAMFKKRYVVGTRYSAESNIG